MNVLLSLDAHGFAMTLNLRKFGKRSILASVIGAIENILRMIVIHLAVECAWCLCGHGVPFMIYVTDKSVNGVEMN